MTHPTALPFTYTQRTKQQRRALIHVHSSRTTKETGEIMIAHKKRGESDPSNCTMVTAERGIGKTREGADGGVTLREKRGRREVRDTVAMPICFLSGHKLVHIEESHDKQLNCSLEWSMEFIKSL